MKVATRPVRVADRMREPLCRPMRGTRMEEQQFRGKSSPASTGRRVGTVRMGRAAGLALPL
jgi:hypothetical protein